MTLRKDFEPAFVRKGDGEDREELFVCPVCHWEMRSPPLAPGDHIICTGCGRILLVFLGLRSWARPDLRSVIRED